MNEIHNNSEPGYSEALAGFDLNLLVAFDVLTQECSVTRAARRMNLTQSAMSHALRRLRDLLGDPLLVRGRGGMVLTPRAEILSVPVRGGLVTLHRAVSQPTKFDPGSAKRTFRLTSPDLFDLLVLPPLLKRLCREAPGINIAVAEVAERQLMERLETGEVDFAILPRMNEPETVTDRPDPNTAGLRRRKLFDDRLVCFLRAGHPEIRTRPRRRGKAGSAMLSLETYVKLSHAVVSPDGFGTGPVDDQLKQQRLGRRVALRLPNFFSALAVVAKSDLVLTAPTGLRRFISPKSAVVALPPPLMLPGHSINLVWHERFSNDPGHAWLRNLITEVAKTEFSKTGKGGM